MARGVEISGEIGEVVAHRGQSYELVRRDPYRCVDGREIELLVWRSQCADCGAVFEFKAPRRARLEPNRRCPQHRAPGRRVCVAVEA